MMSHPGAKVMTPNPVQAPDNISVEDASLPKVGYRLRGRAAILPVPHDYVARTARSQRLACARKASTSSGGPLTRVNIAVHRGDDPDQGCRVVGADMEQAAPVVDSLDDAHTWPDTVRDRLCGLVQL